MASFFRPLQEKSMPDDVVLKVKLLRLRLVRPGQIMNMPLMSVTFAVLNLLTSRLVSLPQP